MPRPGAGGCGRTVDQLLQQQAPSTTTLAPWARPSRTHRRPSPSSSARTARRAKRPLASSTNTTCLPSMSSTAASGSETPPPAGTATCARTYWPALKPRARLSSSARACTTRRSLSTKSSTCCRVACCGCPSAPGTLTCMPAFKRPARLSGTSSSNHRRSGSPIIASGCSLSGLTAMPGLIRRSTSTPSMGARSGSRWSTCWPLPYVLAKAVARA